MHLTRRDALGLLAGSSAAMLGGCCTRRYPEPELGGSRARIGAVPPLLKPAMTTARRSTLPRVIDVHAHFFNASDVPVRGFLAECLGHSAPPLLRPFIVLLAPLAEIIARRAPTAARELAELQALIEQTRSQPAERTARLVEDRLDRAEEETARDVVAVIRGTEFERAYRAAARTAGRSAGPVTETDVLAVLRQSRRPSPSGRPARSREPAQQQADAADGVLAFLTCMLARRYTNLRSYHLAYTSSAGAFGIETVLGALVDFDYWLECPPYSAHDDQITLHALLAELHGGYFRPVAAYNPWTDINQKGAGLARAIDACANRGFAGVKIYPPTGFLPAGNAANPVETSKKRPDLRALDEALGTFFDACAARGIPVISHTARSNGRDVPHDDFGGPVGWQALLERYAQGAKVPVVDLGHFGGARGSDWTQVFAEMMKGRHDAPWFGDLGFWDELMCDVAPAEICSAARQRLKCALDVPLGQDTVASRVMFGTDWLMLSQIKGWPDYPAQLLESLRAIAAEADVARIFGANAEACFPGAR